MKKTAVIYYSMYGNTRRFAEKIAKRIGADLVEIKTEKEYPDDYDVVYSLGKKEVESGYIPRIQDTGIDLSEYSAIILGTPVWWGTLTPAVKSFIYSKKWKGVKVFPFAVYDDKPGRIVSEFRNALKGATVEKTLCVKFDDRTQLTSDDVVNEWIAGLLGE